MSDNHFQRAFSNAPWESQIGYCRVVRAGNLVYVTGTAPVDDNGGTYAPGKPYEQARRCFELIEKALSDVGASITDVVRTRIFVTDISLWEEFGRAHKEVFAEHPPATTMVEVNKLISPDMLIEVEADVVCE